MAPLFQLQQVALGHVQVSPFRTLKVSLDGPKTWAMKLLKLISSIKRVTK